MELAREVFLGGKGMEGREGLHKGYLVGRVAAVMALCGPTCAVGWSSHT